MLNAGLLGAPSNPPPDGGDIAAGELGLFPPNWKTNLGRFGDYELLEEIAHGGMGVVYRARQINLNRTVAVKMLLLGQFSSEQSVQRFHREATAAASLQHPNIVAIHEVGAIDGQHFFSMDYVEGQSLAAIIRANPLPALAAATYCRAIAQAIAYAHDRGIVHRDLKPSNVLVDIFDQVRITDFGLAKQLDGSSDLTLTGHMLGSPNYLPPELAAGKQSEASVASDVYSIGAILYECLTGRPPFLADSLQETLLKIRDTEVPTPRLLNSRIPRELETICLKCLEKNPASRYVTAQELVEDLARFLNHEPIHARPVTPVERVWRWCRRKPVLASFVASTASLLLAILIGSPIATFRIARERANTQANLVRQYVATGNRLAEQRHFLDALPWFAEALHLENEPDRMEIHQLRLAFTLAECPVPKHLWFHDGQILAAEFRPDGEKVAVGTSGGTVSIWNVRDGRPAALPLKHGQRIQSLKFSPDGRWLLTVATGRDETSPRFQLATESKARLWDAASGALRLELAHSSRITTACFSGNGARVATTSHQDGVRIWDIGSGAEFIAVPETTNAVDVVWSQDNKSLFVCLGDGSISRRELGGGKPVWSSQHKDAAHLVLNSSGELLLSFGRAHKIEIRNAATGKRLLELSDSEYAESVGFNHAEFSRDGQQVLGACRDAAATIWAVSDGRRVTRIRQIQHVSVAVFDFTAHFGHDWGSVITGSNAGARVWDAITGLALSPPLTAFTHVRVAKFSPNGEYLLTAGADSVCRLWGTSGVTQNRFVLPWHGAVDNCAFSRDGQRLVLCGSNTAAIWSGTTGVRLSANLLQNNGGSHVDYAEFSPDGRKLVSTGRGEAIVWDTASGHSLFSRLRHSTTGDIVARFAPNGQQIITFGTEGTVRLWNAETGKEEMLPYLIQHGGAIDGLNFEAFNGFDFTADGTLLLTAGADHAAQLWNLKSGQSVGPPWLHSAGLTRVTFSRDGRLAATADADGVARVWRVPSGAEVCPPLTHFGLVAKAVFGKDGTRLLTASFDRLATVWDVPSGRALVRLPHGDYVNDAEFSPDERLIATASEQGLRLWDGTTGEPVSTYLPNSPNSPSKAQAWRVKFSPDGRFVLACSQYARNAMLYRLPLDTRTEADWLDLAAISSAQHVLADGRLETLTPAELASAWKRISHLRPQHLTTERAK